MALRLYWVRGPLSSLHSSIEYFSSYSRETGDCSNFTCSIAIRRSSSYFRTPVCSRSFSSYFRYGRSVVKVMRLLTVRELPVRSQAP